MFRPQPLLELPRTGALRPAPALCCSLGTLCQVIAPPSGFAPEGGETKTCEHRGSIPFSPSPPRLLTLFVRPCLEEDVPISWSSGVLHQEYLIVYI